MSEERKLPPLHARLFRYQLDATELHLLRTMLEFNSEGTLMWPSLKTLSIFSKLSEKQIKRLIRGWTNKRTGTRTAGLLERGILTELTPANSKRMRKPASYRLNEAALVPDPEVTAYLEAQERRNATLPGIELPAGPGDPIRPRQKSLPGVRPGATSRQKHMRWGTQALSIGDTVSPIAYQEMDTVSPLDQPRWGTPCPVIGDTVSPDLLIDSLKTKTSTTTEEFPAELAKGLRAFVPLLDDGAIKQIWLGCKANAPDCTVEEIMHFAWQKKPALDRANNPTGLLIHSVKLCVTPDALVALRNRREREEQDRQAAEQQRVIDAEQMRLDVEQLRREEYEFNQALAKLDDIPTEQFQALRTQAETPEIRQYRSKMASRQYEEIVRRQMVKIQLGSARVAKTLTN
jgi:hypothetical protein